MVTCQTFMEGNPNDDLKPSNTLGFTNSNTHILRDELFWLNHKGADGGIASFVSYGNRCKVEVISRSDLLRARGYKV